MNQINKSLHLFMKDYLSLETMTSMFRNHMKCIVFRMLQLISIMEIRRMRHVDKREN